MLQDLTQNKKKHFGFYKKWKLNFHLSSVRIDKLIQFKVETVFAPTWVWGLAWMSSRCAHNLQLLHFCPTFAQHFSILNLKLVRVSVMLMLVLPYLLKYYSTSFSLNSDEIALKLASTLCPCSGHFHGRVVGDCKRRSLIGDCLPGLQEIVLTPSFLNWRSLSPFPSYLTLLKGLQ